MASRSNFPYRSTIGSGSSAADGTLAKSPSSRAFAMRKESCKPAHPTFSSQ
nr:MAG TPA: hypothetical protein [Caudoviricetes sp.]